MSIEYLNFAFKSPISKSSTKFVFVALSDYANEVGEAYPSIETLCNKTSLNRKTVINALKELRDLGLIADTHQNRGHTKQVKVWQLHMIDIAPIPSHSELKNSTKNGTVQETSETDNSTENGTVPILPPKGTENGSVKPSQKRYIEPSVSLTISESPDIVQNPTFDQFYNAYGQKKKRVDAERAWNRLSKEDRQAAFEAIPAFNKSIPDYHDKPHPSTYLNGKRWTDDLTPWQPPQKLQQPEGPRQAAHVDAKERARQQAEEERQDRQREAATQQARNDQQERERRSELERQTQSGESTTGNKPKRLGDVLKTVRQQGAQQ